MRISSLSPIFASLAVSTLLVSSPALAEMMKMAATLEASQEVPPNDSAGKGTAELTFDSETKMLEWTVEYSDLSGPATAGHLHGPAAAGENADVAVPFEGDVATSPVKGSATLTDAQAADLMAGKYYVNIHTDANKGGEIRGQVEKAM